MSILKEAIKLIKESDPAKIEEILNNMTKKNVNFENLNNHELNPTFMDVLPIIPNPHNLGKNSDPLSLIYSQFVSNTDIPPALPVFSFLSYLSAFAVNNNIMYKHPTSPADYLNTWTLILAPSGSAKTLSSKVIEKSIPKNIDDEPMITPNFEGADGSAAFVAELAKAEKKIDNFGKPIQPIFWIEDEYSQFMKKLMPNGSMVETRKIMLKIHDNDKAKRITKKETVETESLVMSALFLNTIDSFARNFDQESINDGLGRRHNFIYAERSKKTTATYDLEKVVNSLKPTFDKFFTKVKTNIIYTYSPECREIYDHFYMVYKEKFDEILGPETNGTFFRTYFMLAWKYAAIFHMLLEEKGTVIQPKSFDYGIKVSLMFLTSIKRFIDYKIDLNSGAKAVRKEYLNKRADKELNNLDKYKEYLLDNPEISLRDFNRKFTFKKADSLKIIKTIKANNMIKYHPLFDVLAKEEAKIKTSKPRAKKTTSEAFFDDDTSIFDKI